MATLIKNVQLYTSGDVVDLRIEKGIFTAIRACGELDTAGCTVIDGEGGLAVAPFIEPHVHLDTTQTAGEPNWNMSGTLFEGIERWAERKAMLTHEDVKKRATTTLKWQIANGIQFVRTHVDVSDPELIALKALLELREELKEFIEIQIVAFPQEGINSFPNGKAIMRKAVEMGADVIGAIPHFEFSREYAIDSLHFIFDLAQEFDCLIDVHCDEIDDEQSRFVETVATLAHEKNMGHRVTASHTTAMHSYNDAYASRLFRLLKLSGISFVANPLVNIHLQGRFDSYPKRRGVTRVKEMLAANINVCFGHDDIFDPWYPLGTANMLQVTHMGLHVCQIMGYDQIDQSLKLITDNSAQTLNIQDRYGIEEGKPGNLVILPADSGYDAIRRQTAPRYVIRGGKVLAETQPSVTQLYLAQSEVINFKR